MVYFVLEWFSSSAVVAAADAAICFICIFRCRKLLCSRRLLGANVLSLHLIYLFFDYQSHTDFLACKPLEQYKTILFL